MIIVLIQIVYILRQPIFLITLTEFISKIFFDLYAVVSIVQFEA